MALSVNIANPNYNSWISKQNDWLDTQKQANAASLVQIALQTAQLIAYYNLSDDAVDSRDNKIDKQLSFMSNLNAYKYNNDLPMLDLKASILVELELPLVNMCHDAIFCQNDILSDGVAVDNKSQDYINQSCAGAPQGWGVHDGNLFSSKVSSFVGGVVSNSSTRERESFTRNKTDLVRSAQQGMKAVFNAETVLAQYSQSASIYAGLADLFIQGFNSAGAGLGVALGRMTNNTPTLSEQSR